MSTNIYLFNGTLLTTIADGTIDTTHSTLQLPGKGYQNYGEPVVQDILWAATNFAGSSQPGLPIAGQTWYNTSTNVLYVYTGSVWQSAGGVLVSPTQPAVGSNVGAFWYDSVNLQLYIWDGSRWDLLGPLGSAINQDPMTNTIIPNFSQVDSSRLSDGTSLHQVWRMTIGGILFAIISKDAAFSPSPAMTGFPTIYPGINFNNTISGITINGDSTLFKSTKNNLPITDNTYNMGSSGNRFANMYTVNQYVSTGLAVNTSTIGSYSLNVVGSAAISGQLTLGPGNTSNPPLVLTAGSLASSITSGALEFDGYNLWLTVTQNSTLQRVAIGGNVAVNTVIGADPYDLNGTIIAGPGNYIGADGNYYMGRLNTNIWGPKANGAWPTYPTSYGNNRIKAITASETLVAYNCYITIIATTTVITTLPAPTDPNGNGGNYFVISNDSIANQTVSAPANGILGLPQWPSNMSSITLVPSQIIYLVSDNSSWRVVSDMGDPWRANTIIGLDPSNDSGGTVIATPANTIGYNGDYYMGKLNTSIWGPKANGAWPATPVSWGNGRIIGVTGNVGNQILVVYNVYVAIKATTTVITTLPNPVDPNGNGNNTMTVTNYSGVNQTLATSAGGIWGPPVWPTAVSSITLAPNQILYLVSDDTNWVVVSNNQP